MTRDEKMNLRRRMSLRDFCRRFDLLSKLLLKITLLAAYVAGAVYVSGKQDAVDAFMRTLVVPAPLVEVICSSLLRSYLLAGAIVLAVLLMYPFQRKMFTDGCLRIALTNAAGETPSLLRERSDQNNRHVKIWEINNPGIPLKLWQDKQPELEAVFDLNLVSVAYGVSTARIILKFVSCRNALPNHIGWRDDYLSEDSFVLALGEGYTGPVTVDLA